MTDMLPIVEQLADCRTDAARAQWLFSCPLTVLYRDDSSIRTILRQRGFLAGIDYLDAQLSVMRAVRGPFGLFTAETAEMLISAFVALAVAVELSRPADEATASPTLADAVAFTFSSPSCVHFAKRKEA